MKVQEWLNWHAWKACKPLKGFGGSNLPLSAEIEMNESWNKCLTLFFSRDSNEGTAGFVTRSRGTLFRVIPLFDIPFPNLTSVALSRHKPIMNADLRL